ncbi:transposase IS4 family protein [mine drainage metagenome]|uniref:Transposase IS4 family protein n=1 Tax=mine drainage metagenome TaxID=410659 RepID=T1AV44_9ZZZZ
MQKSYHNSKKISVSFDDDKSVSGAGLVLLDMLSTLLDIEKVANEKIDLGSSQGSANPGRKVLTLLNSLALGGECIDDADVLRSGSTEKVLSHKVIAPSTLGTFLRSFTFGNIRQLDSLFEEVLGKAWALGAGPGDNPLTIDIDSTIVEVYGKDKQGSGYGYTKVLGQHPLIATRAETGEVLHIRHRKGSSHTGRGADYFVRETITRVKRQGANGEITLRADSGFYSSKVFKACSDHNVKFSITAKLTSLVKEAIYSIEDSAWKPIDYTLNGEAEVSETTYLDYRLIVRRTRITGEQEDLFPNWRYHAFITDLSGEAIFLDQFHRKHAVVELAIKDLKEGSGLNHLPSGKFNANAAWCVLSSLAHNLIRWLNIIGLEQKELVVTKTIRRKLLNISGRITRKSRQIILHLPTNWPWAKTFSKALSKLQSLQVLVT